MGHRPGQSKPARVPPVLMAWFVPSTVSGGHPIPGGDTTSATYPVDDATDHAGRLGMGMAFGHDKKRDRLKRWSG